MQQKEQRLNRSVDPIPVKPGSAGSRRACLEVPLPCREGGARVVGSAAHLRARSSQGARVVLISDWSLFRAGLRIALSREARDLQYLEAGSLAALKKQAIELKRIDCFLIDREIPDFQACYQQLVGRGYPCIVISRFYGRGCLISGALDSNLNVRRVTMPLLRLVGADQRVFYDREAYLQQSRRDRRSAAAPLSSHLSVAQCAVLKLLCDGASNREIASAMAISVHTVKAHLGRIYRKMDVSSRTQLVAMAAQTLRSVAPERQV